MPRSVLGKEKTVEFLQTIANGDLWRNYSKFIGVIVGMLDDSSSVNKSQKAILIVMLADKFKFQKMHSYCADDDLYVKAVREAMPIATWLNTCH